MSTPRKKSSSVRKAPPAARKYYDPARREFDDQAALLFVRFGTYAQVAKTLGIGEGMARSAVHRSFNRIPEDTVVLHRKVAIARLQSQAVIALAVAEEDHLAVSHGKVVTRFNPDTGEEEPVYDRMVNLAALDRLKAVQDQINKLVGAYAPATVRLEVVPADVLEDMVRENREQIRRDEEALGISHAELPSASQRADEELEDDEIAEAELVDPV